MSFEQDLAEQRSYLLKFARLQLRNQVWAEDAVSETLLAALSKPQSYSGKSALRTWLIGILKHKVIDMLRANLQETNFSDMQSSADDEDDTDLIDALGFEPEGHFSQRPTAWGLPEQELTRRQFMAVLDACIAKLPPVQGRLFLMREWLELDAEEVCKTLNITSTNLYVQLHRARLRLRECLELHWFGSAEVS